MNIHGNPRRNMIIIVAFVVLLGIVQQVMRSQLIFRISNQTVNDLEAVTRMSEPTAGMPEGYEPDKFLLVYNPEDEVSNQLKENVVQVLHYMKKTYDAVDIRSVPDPVPPSYRSAIVTTSDWGRITGLKSLENYVFEGGHVFFAMRPEVEDTLYEIYRKLGITSFGLPYTSKEVFFHTNVLFRAAGDRFIDDFLSNSALSLILDGNCRVHATTTNDTPLLWDADYGDGRFMVFNGTILQSKMNRGILAGALSLLNQEQAFIYPVMNMKLAYIDDFPAPFPEGTDPVLKEQYGRDIRRFFREIWWPDIMKAAARFDVKYTGVLIETYNNKVAPPFDAQGSDSSGLILYGRELLKNGGEIGIHGYNHQSLETEPAKSHTLGYQPWANGRDMQEALSEVYRYSKGVFPKYTFRTYVPPSNILSQEGRAAIKTAFPDLKIISSVYHEDYRNLAYVQEFKVASDGMFELPRVTSGYEFDANKQWLLMNAITSIGVYSHFIHPDDLFDVNRNGNKSWKELSKEYEDLLAFTNQRYGWLKPLTASSGAYELGKYVTSSVAFKQDKEHIEGFIEGFHGGMDFILRTDRKIGKLTNCSVTHIDEDVYLVHANKANFVVGVEA
ncbi:DUF2194 domain-containing protein [Gorillibacterium sp. sgz5001074]|uniref:DUF2194 domain-containing protein n=1 Tax=Gorillibacterium sp. sgz5001074 TaxID=3446695 RepID=UPI003F674A00